MRGVTRGTDPWGSGPEWGLAPNLALPPDPEARGPPTGGALRRPGRERKAGQAAPGQPGLMRQPRPRTRRVRELR